MRGYIFKAVGLFMLAFVISCKTTAPVATKTKADSSPAQEDLPLLKIEAMDSGMLERMTAYGRRDAEAIFGSKAFMHTIAFDNIMTDGLCAGVLGARIVYANGDLENGASRPYAMVTLNPKPSGLGHCVYEGASALKSSSDVGYLVRENRNFENEFENFSQVKLSFAQVIETIKQRHPKFSSVVAISLVSPVVPGMAKNPWVMVLGESCGTSALVYVNLSSGDVLEGPRGVKGGC